MSPIDGDALYEKVEAWYKNAQTPFRQIYRSFVDAVADAPTIPPPPDDPLTLEQLREMDGEPVFIDFDGVGECTIVRIRLERPYLTLKNAICSPANFVFECGGKVYRHRPEEGTWQR